MNILYTGPMKAGKSRALIETVQKLVQNKESWVCFKPNQDVRDLNQVASRDSLCKSLPALVYKEDREILESREFACNKYIILDEIFMFGPALVPILRACAYQHKHVVAASLTRDFKRDWFVLDPLHTTQDILGYFDYVFNLTANCDVCAQPAQYTQRLINGQPATRQAPSFAIVGVEYQARCKTHYEVKDV